MWPADRKRWATASASAALLFLAVLLMQYWGSRFILPHPYVYQESRADNGVTLHAMAVSPGRVELRAADRPLSSYRVYGINGGFFYQEAVLSIAVNGDKPVNGAAGAYGSGWFNEKYPRGTLVWDEAAGTFSVQLVSSADEIRVKDRSRYFAQGGVSMGLGDEPGWEAAMQREHLPNPDENRLRSGLVFDATGTLWLIVTPDRCTAAAFREAVQEEIAPDIAKEGIFLDGDGSAQMNAAETKLRGDSRDLRQMIVIK